MPPSSGSAESNGSHPDFHAYKTKYAGAVAMLKKEKLIGEKEGLTVHVLARILRKIKTEAMKSASGGSTSRPKHNTTITEGLEAIARLLEETGDDLIIDRALEHLRPNLEETIGKAVEDTREAVRELVETEIKDDLRMMMEEMNNNYVKNRNEMREMLDTMIENVQKTAERTPEMASNPIPQQSYADIARQITQPTHETYIQKGKMTKRQMILKKIPGATGESLATLNEEEILAKINLTIDLMGVKAADKPEGFKVLATRKLAGGDTVLQLDSIASAEWLRQPDVLKAFNDHIGAAATIRPRTFNVIVEMVPISAEITNKEMLREIENTNGLPIHSITSGNWLKLPERRRYGQKYAHAQLGCTDPNTANRIMQGICIRGCMINGRKPEIQIPRCLRCQHRGYHRAEDCKSEHPICGRCRDDHWTTECTKTEKSEFRCNNCKGEGHGAIDVECPDYQRKLDTKRKKTPEINYRYYPTKEPWTWVRYEEERNKNAQSEILGTSRWPNSRLPGPDMSRTINQTRTRGPGNRLERQTAITRYTTKFTTAGEVYRGENSAGTSTGEQQQPLTQGSDPPRNGSQQA